MGEQVRLVCGFLSVGRMVLDRHGQQLARPGDIGGALAVGGTPSGPVVAEDIRDLQCWPGHGWRALGRRGSGFLLLLALLRG